MGSSVRLLHHGSKSSFSVSVVIKNVTFGARKGRYNTKYKPTRRYGPFRTISLLKWNFILIFILKITRMIAHHGNRTQVCGLISRLGGIRNRSHFTQHNQKTQPSNGQVHTIYKSCNKQKIYSMSL
jgi:polyferredoxin